MAPGGGETAKVSIIGQISEVEREIAMRKQVYPRQVGSGKMRQAEADLLLARMEAVRQTLIFCHAHEADIRAYIASKRGAQS